MITIILFYTSFFFLIVMLTMEYFGVSFRYHKLTSDLICKNDKHCHKIVHHSKKVVSKIKFKNFHRLAIIIINFIKKEVIYLKRKFDSKQPSFFLIPQTSYYKNKNSVSFFLKKVSEYKDSLKGEKKKNIKG